MMARRSLPVQTGRRVYSLRSRAGRESMKRLSFLAGLAVAAATPALSAASPQACVNTRLGYEARPVGTREVMVRNSLGEHRAELRLTTTCFAMNREDAVRID